MFPFPRIAIRIRHEQFSGHRIIEAKSRSRAASQFGAQPDEASNRLTRRPATHHHAPDSRARLQRDCGLSADYPRRFARTAHGQVAATVTDWTRRGHGLTVDPAAVTNWTRPARGCGHQCGHLAGRIAASPRLLRGLKSLPSGRSKACAVKNVRLTRRPPTQNRAPDFRARSHAIVDCLLTVCVPCRCQFMHVAICAD